MEDFVTVLLVGGVLCMALGAAGLCYLVFMAKEFEH